MVNLEAGKYYWLFHQERIDWEVGKCIYVNEKKDFAQFLVINHRYMVELTELHDIKELNIEKPNTI